MVMINWITTCRKMKLDSYLTPLTEINSTWIKDSNIRHEAIKLEESIGNNLLNTGLGHVSLDMTPKAQTTKEKKKKKVGPHQT